MSDFFHDLVISIDRPSLTTISVMIFPESDKTGFQSLCSADSCTGAASKLSSKSLHMIGRLRFIHLKLIKIEQLHCVWWISFHQLEANNSTQKSRLSQARFNPNSTPKPLRLRGTPRPWCHGISGQGPVP